MRCEGLDQNDGQFIDTWSQNCKFRLPKGKNLLSIESNINLNEPRERRFVLAVQTMMEVD